MALTGEGLWNARKAAMAAVIDAYSQTHTAADAIELRDALGLADSTAIINYLVANTVVATTSGAPDGEHTGEIS